MQHTTGGTSASAVSKSQVTPLQWEHIEDHCDSQGGQPPPYLFPEGAMQTQQATCISTQVKQANQHDEKQQDVSISGNVENTFLTFLTFFNLLQERYATFFTCMILLLLTS
jgi:hypothetical protein